MINLKEDFVEKMAHSDGIENPAVQKASDEEPKNFESSIYGEIKKSIHKLEEEFEKLRLAAIKEIDLISKRMKDWRSDSDSICLSPGLKDEVELEWAHMDDGVVQKRAEAMKAHLTLEAFKNAFVPKIEEFENAEMPLNTIGIKNNIWWIVGFMVFDGFLAYFQWRDSEGFGAALFITIAFASVSVGANGFAAWKYKQRKPYKNYTLMWKWLVFACLFNYIILNGIHWARNAQSDLTAPYYAAWLTDYIPPSVNSLHAKTMARFGYDPGKASIESINAVFFWLTFFLNLGLLFKSREMFEKYDGYSLKKHDYEIKKQVSIDAHDGFKKTIETFFDAKKKAIDIHILGAKAVEEDLLRLKELFQNNMKKYQGNLTDLDAEARKYVSLYRAKWQEAADFSKAPPRFWSREFTLNDIDINSILKEIFNLVDPKNKSVIEDINSLESKFSDQSGSDYAVRKGMIDRKNAYIKECTELIKNAPTLEIIDEKARKYIQPEQKPKMEA